MSGQLVDINFVQDTPNINYDWVWDLTVPKDSDAATTSADMYDDVDLTSVLVEQSGENDTTPVYHPGYLNVEHLFGDPTGNVEFFKREKILTFCNSPSGFDYSAANFTPTDLVRTKIDFGFGGRVEGPHIAMMGIGNPDMTNTDATVPNIIGEQEWAIMGEMERVIDLMYIHAMGLSGLGTAAPYDDVAFFIAKLLEARVVEEDAGKWDTTSSLVTFTKATWDISTPNRGNPRILASG